MTRRIVHQIVDDLDGTVLDVGSGETVHYSLDGVAYEIDVSDTNAQALRDAVAPFIAVSRRTGSPSLSGSSSSAPRKRRRAGQQDFSGIREWAKDNGYTVSERGRVPASVLEAYDAAH